MTTNATGDTRRARRHDELEAYPGGQGQEPAATDVVVPLRYRGEKGVLRALGAGPGP
jgi:hypothetical protein